MTNHAPIPRSAQAALILTALACIAPSASINVVHVFGHTPGALGVPLALASVLSVALAAASPFAIEKALKTRNAVLLLIALAVGGVCLTYNLSVAVGAASTTRAELTGSRTAESNKAAMLSGQLALAEKSRAVLARTSREKTPGMWQAEISGLEQATAWTSTRQCTNITLPASRSHCQAYVSAQAALAAAKKVETLDSQIARLKTQLLKSGPATGQPADPQAANIAAALAFVGLKVEAADIGVALNLSLAVLVELIGAFGPVIFAAAFLRGETPAEAATATKAAKGRKAVTKKKPAAAAKRKKASPKASPAGNVLQIGDALAERKQRIAELRAEGKTQIEIAALLGISRATVQRLMAAS